MIKSARYPKITIWYNLKKTSTKLLSAINPHDSYLRFLGANSWMKVCFGSFCFGSVKKITLIVLLPLTVHILV